MIFLTTRGWTGAQVSLYIAGEEDSWVVPVDVANPLDVGQAFVDWCNEPARPWSSSASAFLLTWEPAGARLRAVLTWSGPAADAIDATDAWAARFGRWWTGQAALGSSSAEAFTENWAPRDAGRGVRTTAAGWRLGHPRTSHRRPTVRFVWTLAQYWEWRGGLPVAANPRSAYVWDEAHATWRFVALGEISLEHPDGDTTQIVGTMACAGAP